MRFNLCVCGALKCACVFCFSSQLNVFVLYAFGHVYFFGDFKNLKFIHFSIRRKINEQLSIAVLPPLRLLFSTTKLDLLPTFLDLEIRIQMLILFFSILIQESISTRLIRGKHQSTSDISEKVQMEHQVQAQVSINRIRNNKIQTENSFCFCFQVHCMRTLAYAMRKLRT